ncbi:cyclic nucleotide-binding domain-containing protein [Chitinophagales bacterium]|nr:cyclic nucleotide-binding domain-containing protein [Chitinophagales bacterium]
MKEVLDSYIRTKVKHPSESELLEILDIFEPKKLKKKEFVKRPFTIGKELGFLTSGSVRGAFYKENGEETTFRILQEGSFIGDAIGVRTQTATPIGFDCISDIEILTAPIEKVHKLLESNLAMNIVMREYITDNAIEMGRRHLLFLTGSAKERYLFLLENKPKLLKKFPLRLIASMIGITPTQLSRIRNKNSD